VSARDDHPHRVDAVLDAMQGGERDAFEAGGCEHLEAALPVPSSMDAKTALKRLAQ
jgi:hypothetical protein